MQYNQSIFLKYLEPLEILMYSFVAKDTLNQVDVNHDPKEMESPKIEKCP